MAIEVPGNAFFPALIIILSQGDFPGCVVLLVLCEWISGGGTLWSFHIE